MITLASAFLYGCAGFCVYLAVLNRHIVLMRDSTAKHPLMVGIFIAMVGGAALAGLMLPRAPWIYVPIGVLCLVAVGEARRALIRRRCRGSSPVNSAVHNVSLSKPFTTTDLACHRYELKLVKWKGTPFRIVHLSDLHASPSYPVEYYNRVFTVAEEQEPDLVFITGDLAIHHSALGLLSEIIRPLGRTGCFAVLGNHDYWTGPDPVREVVRNAGIRLLTNESVPVTIGGGNVLITGCDDPWGERPWAPPVVEESTLHLALSHTPDNIYRLAQAKLDCVFCGHYHAGQFRIPGLGAFVIPSVYGRRFDHGHYRVQGTEMFIAAGVGASTPPFRIYCQPDIFTVDILPGVC